LAATAEGKTAILADGKKIRHLERSQFLLGGQGRYRLLSFIVRRVLEVKTHWFFVLLRLGCAVTPLSRAVDCVLVRLELVLVLEVDVS
jgi:hypothetical protein